MKAMLERGRATVVKQTFFPADADMIPPVVCECDWLESYAQPPLELRLLNRVLVYSFDSGKLKRR